MTPFVKGAKFLRRIEAKTPVDLAVTYLKGIKLIYWVLILQALLKIMMQALHGGPARFYSIVPGRNAALTDLRVAISLGLPTLEEAFNKSVARNPHPWYICWRSLIGNFLEEMLGITI